MIKAIQTRYAGYFFRSRLEARWAVFFDALKLKWQYEPEGFDLPSGVRYLPDFRVDFRRGSLWIEIKPKGKGSSPFYEFMFFAPNDWYGTILHEIPDPRIIERSSEYYDNDEPFVVFGRNGERDEWEKDRTDFPEMHDNFYKFCICESCGEVGFTFDGRSARIGCKCSIHDDSDKNYTPDHPIIVAAFAKARAARFEYEQRETYLSV